MSLWLMLWTAASVVADRRSCGLIDATAVWLGRRSDRAAAAESARQRHGSGTGTVGQCGIGVLARHDDDGGVSDGGSGAVGGQCRWWSDEEFWSADGLTRWSGDWINRIARLTRCAAPGGVEIDLSGGGADEGSERLRGSEPNWIPCRKNRLCIVVDCIVLCLSAGIYRV
jgi:hypothetical protein